MMNNITRRDYFISTALRSLLAGGCGITEAIEVSITIADGIIQKTRSESEETNSFYYSNDFFDERTRNALKRRNIKSIEELASLSAGDMWRTQNVGPKTMKRLRDYLASNGMSFSHKSTINLTDKH